MKLDLLGVQAFVSIASQTSFQRAAIELQISQPVLSRRLRNLETRLGVKLIEHSSRPIVLTAMGIRLLARARRLMDDFSDALVELVESAKARHGVVCIACAPSAGIQIPPRIVKEFSDSFPDNRIRILDNSSSSVWDAVLKHEAELGIDVALIHHPDLITTELPTDQFVLICRDDHALVNKKSLTWKQLAPHRLILAEEAHANLAVLDQTVDGRKAKSHRRYEVQRSSTALGMVVEGVAIALVPQRALHSRAYPRVRGVTLIDPPVSQSLVLVTRKGAPLSSAARALYELFWHGAAHAANTAEFS